MRHHCPTAPFIIVGTKLDLREDPAWIDKLAAEGLKPKTPDDGARLTEELMAYAYLECSALSQDGLKDVFDEAIRCALLNKQRPKKKKKGLCVML